MTLRLQEKLLKRTRLGNLRQLHSSPNLIDFASNDYLGLSRSSTLSDAVTEELYKYKLEQNGLGSTGSRLLTGNSSYAEELENNIASFHGFESGLLFNCGYMANVGLLSMVADIEDCILFDTKVHASTRDGIYLSKASAFPFKHNDTQHLERRLQNCTGKGDRFICVESIYSTDGTVAPLLEICRIAKKYGANLIVDEAHAIGACGPKGRGVVAELNLCSQIFALIITFGKALGVHGAIILGSQVLKQSLINFATPFIYTTALPLHSLAAIKFSYSIFPMMECERRQLQKLVQCYREFIPDSTSSHIQSIRMEGNRAVNDFAQKIGKAGFDVRPLMSPTVKRGQEVLRICLHAFNTENELKMLLKLINSLRK